MTHWHEILTIELRQRAMAHGEFAARIGRPAGTVSRWLSGEDVTGDGDSAAIARTLGMSHAYLRDRLDDVPGSWAAPPDARQSLDDRAGRLPVEVEILEEAQSNDPLMVQCGFRSLGRIFLPYEPGGDPSGRHEYVGHVNDQPYMEPAIRAGDVLIVDECAPWKPGDVVAGSFGEGPPHRHLMRVVAGERAAGSPRPDWDDASAGAIRLRSDGDGIDLIDPGYVVGKVVMVNRDLAHDAEPDALAWFRRTVTRRWLPGTYRGRRPDRTRRGRGVGNRETDRPRPPGGERFAAGPGKGCTPARNRPDNEGCDASSGRLIDRSRRPRHRPDRRTRSSRRAMLAIAPTRQVRGGHHCPRRERPDRGRPQPHERPRPPLPDPALGRAAGAGPRRETGSICAPPPRKDPIGC